MRMTIAITVLLGTLIAPPARADDLSPSAGVQALGRQGTAQKGQVLIYADPVRGIRFADSEGDYGIQFSGLFQEDSRNYIYGYLKPQPNEFVDARSRLIVDALLGPRVKLRYQEDFSNNGSGPVLLDAYGELKLESWAILRVGQFKTPLDLERWRITPALDFIQYSYTAGLVTDRSQGALLEFADPAQILLLDAGAFDGDTDAGSTPVTQAYNSDKDAVARLFVQPFHTSDGGPLRKLGIGVAGSAGNHSGDPEQTYKSEGQLTIVSFGGTSANTVSSYTEGAGYRVIPQAYWFWEGVDVQGEYVHASQGYRISTTLQNEITDSEAWQAQAGWVLTGEDASYDGLKLQEGTSSSWGGLQLVGRVQGVDYDEGAYTTYSAAGAVLTKRLIDPSSSVSGLKSWTVGLNYVPVNDVKFLLDWDQTTFTGGGGVAAGAGKTLLVNRPTEQVLQARAQFAF